VLLGFSTTYDAVSNVLRFISDRSPRPKVINIPLTFPASHESIIATFETALKGMERHKGQKVVAVIDGIASNPGVRLPWEKMVSVCKAQDVWSVIDGAHCIGQIEIDLHKSDPDFFISNCHKWLYAKRGCAVLYVAKRNQTIIKSPFPTSHNYISPGMTRCPRGLYHLAKPNMLPQFEWTGTIDFSPYLSVEAALDFRESIGGEKQIDEYCHDLAIKGGQLLSKLLGTEMMETEAVELTSHMVNVALPLVLSATTTRQGVLALFDRFRDGLLEANCFAATFYHDRKLWTRCSAQIWNELSDFEYVGKVYLPLCKEIQKDINSEKQDQLKAVSVPPKPEVAATDP